MASSTEFGRKPVEAGVGFPRRSYDQRVPPSYDDSSGLDRVSAFIDEEWSAVMVKVVSGADPVELSAVEARRLAAALGELAAALDAHDGEPEGAGEAVVSVDEVMPRRVVLSVEQGGLVLRARLRSYEASQLAGELVRSSHVVLPPTNDAALSVDEFAEMVRLIRRYAVSEMDQWELFSVSIDHGEVYVGISLSVANPADYVKLDGMLAVTDPDRTDAVIVGCLRGAVDGPFFPEWEFATLFGLTRDEVRSVLEAWPEPPADESGDDRSGIEIQDAAVTGAMNNLIGYPHGIGHREFRSIVGATEQEVAAVLDDRRRS